MYYVLISLFLGPFFFLMLLPLFFRYKTMRYRFDDQGVAMRWGVLFRKEISLTYARIQDIHLQSNVVERWLKLARVQVQTASGSASAEMTIEGLHEFEEVRDYLYTRMKSARHGRQVSGSDGDTGQRDVPPPLVAQAGAGDMDELVAALNATREELAQVRQLLETRQGHELASPDVDPASDPVVVSESAVAVAVPMVPRADEDSSDR